MRPILARLALSLGLAVISAAPAAACSLMDGPPAELKQAMLPHLAVALTRYTNHNFTTQDLKLDDLSDPGVVFLDGLGSRCEGLENTIRVSSFRINRAFANGFNCDLRGVLVMRGYWHNASNVSYHTVLDKSECVAIR